jgi:hypothetical protein
MSDDVARLLAHPLRQRLLFEYHEPTSPSKAARRLRQPVNLVSYHTNVLRRRGAIEHFYRSATRPMIEDAEWDSLTQRMRREIVLGSVGATADAVRTAALAGGFDHGRAHLSRSLLEFDEPGLVEAAATLREAIDVLERISAAARERDPDGCERHELVVQFFRSPAP